MVRSCWRSGDSPGSEDAVRCRSLVIEENNISFLGLPVCGDVPIEFAAGIVFVQRRIQIILGIPPRIPGEKKRIHGQLAKLGSSSRAIFRTISGSAANSFMSARALAIQIDYAK